MKLHPLFLFLALLSATAALPVLDNTTPPPTAVEEPALINAASIPKIVIPPLPSAPHKPEQPPPVKPPPTAEPIPPPPIADAADAAYAADAADVELDDLVDDGSDNGSDGGDDGDSDDSSIKTKQQQLKAFVQNTTTNANHPKLEAKKMTCSIENDHLVCASVDLSKVKFEPAECTTATDNNVTICRRSLAAYSSSAGESH